jgi:hypothetical protein
MENDVNQTEESEGELLSYIGRLEEQNRQLRDLLTKSDMQLAQLQLLHGTLISRIEGVRTAMEEKKRGNPQKDSKHNTPLQHPEERKESFAASIIEDEEFRREIAEAIQFAKVWKEKKTTGG